MFVILLPVDYAPHLVIKKTRSFLYLRRIISETEQYDLELAIIKNLFLQIFLTSKELKQMKKFKSWVNTRVFNLVERSR